MHRPTFTYRPTLIQKPYLMQVGWLSGQRARLSHGIGGGFESGTGNTKDHHHNGRLHTASLHCTHALG